MVDETRRKILKTGVAAAAMAAVPPAFAQQSPQNAPAGTFYGIRQGPHSLPGVGLGVSAAMLISGGGLGGSIHSKGSRSPFDAVGEFKGEYSPFIIADFRTATGCRADPSTYCGDMIVNVGIGLMDTCASTIHAHGFCLAGRCPDLLGSHWRESSRPCLRSSWFREEAPTLTF